MLQNAGEFYPFGGFVNQGGKVEAMGAHLGEEHPDPKEAFSFLHDSFAQMEREGKLVAYAVAANVNIPHEYSPPVPDGIRVHVVAPGVCNRYVYTPYRFLSHRKMRKFLGFLRTIEYGETIAVDL